MKRKPPPACKDCDAPVLFIRVWSERVSRYVSVPVSPEPDTAGSVAADAVGPRTGRFLAKDEQPYHHERRYKQHKCPPAHPAPCEPVPEPPQPVTLFDPS